jgi:ubiquinone biosynthesis protein UbiJ
VAVADNGLASAVLGLLQAGLDWGRDTAAALQTDLAEFWQEETRELPSRPEVDAFGRDVDRLRADCDGLEARVRELEDRLTPQP